MRKIGILTFHYSNNYGGVLQAVALQKVVESMGYDVEIIDFVPSNYAPMKLNNSLGIRRNIFMNKLKDLNIVNLYKKIKIINGNSSIIIDKFNVYREENIKMSVRVDEHSIKNILDNYQTIIVGSDQVWNPSQRMLPEYFLDFQNYFTGNKMSYAADSTLSDVEIINIEKLKKSLTEFKFISVRNQHSHDFVENILNIQVPIVADPTILYEFDISSEQLQTEEDYILTYILGGEIDGTHEKALKKIKNEYGNIPVYAIKIPTMNFDLPGYADQVFYDLNPIEWIKMFKNAKFIYTDSFHGVLFSLKNHVPFLAYYTEKLRATRFIDLGERYSVDNYIVQSVEEIDRKNSIRQKPKFSEIDKILDDHKRYSLEILTKALSN